MPIKSRETVEVPLESIPQWLFGTPEGNLPDKPIILDPQSPQKRYLTLLSYRYWSQKLAAGLQDVGLKVGQRVLVLSDNCTTWPIVFMGIIMAGGVVSGGSPSTPIAKLLDQASDVQPAFIFAAEQRYEVATEVAKSMSLSDDHIYLFDDSFIFENRGSEEIAPGGSQHDWVGLLKETSEPFDWTPFVSPEQLATVTFTSGSTGKPKGVMISHYNMVANAVQYIKQQTHGLSGFGQGKELVYVMWTPFHQIIGSTQYCMILPKRGVVNYVMSTFNFEKFLEYIQLYRATDILLLPALVIAMLSSETAKEIDLGSVQSIHVGGAPLRESTLQSLRDIIPNKSLDVREAFGMTEAAGALIGKWLLVPEHVGSQGELFPNCEAKIMTPDGNTELGPNQSGELYVKSPNVATGYCNRPKATIEAFLPGGWLRTGDLAYYDSGNYLYIKDRIQDIIYSADGSYALPTDLESSLIKFPGVKDAGVTLVEPSMGGQHKVPRAFVVLDHEKQTDAAQLGLEFDLRATPQEQLRGGIFEIDQIPRLLSGKIDRVGLRMRQVN